MMVTEQPSRVIRPLKTSRIFYLKIEYFSSPQKKGFTGFFNNDKFLRRPNFLDPSSKNSYKSENQFLLAENVQTRGNTGKFTRVAYLLSSITKVIIFVNGVSSIPFDNRFPDKSRCYTFFGSPNSLYFKLTRLLSVNSSMIIFLLIHKLILIYLSLILAMLCQQNLSTELFIVSSKPRRNTQRKQIYHPQRQSLPHSPMGSNKSQVSFHQYQYELKSKLTVDNKKNLDSYVAANQLMSQTTRNRINAVSQFFKKKDTLVPKKMPIEPSIVTNNPGMMVGSMLKAKKNDKQKSHSLKNIRAIKTSRGDMQYKSSRKNILKSKEIEQELFSYKSLRDYENTMDYYLIKDVELLMSGHPIEYDVFLLKIKKEEEQRKRKNVRKWFHFPQTYKNTNTGQQ